MENASAQNGQGLAERWDRLVGVRDRFSTELESMATEIPGEPSKRLRSCSRWLRKDADLEGVLQRPDALGVCLPLMELQQESALTDSEVANAARMGVCTIARDASASRHFVRQLAYPLGILLGVFLLAMFFSFWVAPHFEEMFAEFGIELPSVTRLVLGTSQMIRSSWWVIVGLALIVAAFNWGWKFTQSGQRSGASNWVDYRMISNRDALATWAWHVSLLLQLGVSQWEAIKTAGLGSSKAWLRRSSLEYSRIGPEHPDAEMPSLTASPRFQMLRRAMMLSVSEGKIGMLQEVASYYWDRDRTVGDWWIKSLSVVLLFVVGFCIFLAICSLFMPLIAIVSGLTGSKY